MSHINGTLDASKNEPVPHAGTTPIGVLVLRDMQARIDMGYEKYGTLLEANNGRDSLMDAYQEVLDLAMYLRQAIEERDNDKLST